MKFTATALALMAASAVATDMTSLRGLQNGAARYTKGDELPAGAVKAPVAEAPKEGNKQMGAARYTKGDDLPAGAVKAPAVEAPKEEGNKRNLADGWYEISTEENQHAENVKADGDKFTMTVGPDANSCKIKGTKEYMGGRFEIKLKSASKMPGVITAIYLASGEGRKGDEELGDQDEIDFEFKGNEPTSVQTNVFLNGQEDLKIIDMGKDTSAEAHNYAIEWDANAINFFIDQENVRTVASGRALKPLKLSVSVWTTMGGWPGLLKWAGETNWAGQDAIAAEFEVVSLPDM